MSQEKVNLSQTGVEQNLLSPDKNVQVIKKTKPKQFSSYYKNTKNDILHERTTLKDIPNSKILLNTIDLREGERPVFEGKTADQVNIAEVIANKGLLSRVFYKQNKVSEGSAPHPNLTTYLPNPPATNIIHDTEQSKFFLPSINRDSAQGWNDYKSSVILTPEGSMNDPKRNYKLLEPALIKTVEENKNTYNQSTKSAIPYSGLYPIIKDDYYLNRSKNENQKLLM